jgi:uncharacterized protein (DUF2235 family)
MAVRWVVCADGTWNEPEQTDEGMPCPSNVVKLAKAVAPLGKDKLPQVVCYHSGVGDRGGLMDHVMGGAFGDGISLNIRDLYLFLVLNYRPGDELFLFGFSRGAYTVRSLAGLIRNCGILQDQYAERYAEAYALYRDRSDETHPSAPLSARFRAQYAWPDFNIRFIGVWDTVGALGIPTPFQMGKRQNEFHDTDLSSHVDYAYQALAIDEQRKPFVPCVWDKQPSSPASQVLEQAWFAGVHCNVGGGYEDAGLSDCALDWMWQRAAKAKLNLEPKQRPAPDPLGAVRDSMTVGYRLLGLNLRVLGSKMPASNESVSDAVEERQEKTNYRPQNLLDFEQEQAPPAT